MSGITKAELANRNNVLSVRIADAEAMYRKMTTEIVCLRKSADTLYNKKCDVEAELQTEKQVSERIIQILVKQLIEGSKHNE